MSTSTITINPKDVSNIRALLSRLGRDEANKAMVRGVNATMPGVRTDGTKILSDHYALTASAIRASWRITRADFHRDPHGVVSCQGTFIRLKEFGARQTKTGISVKVLKKNPRATVAHAFFATLKQNKQVYWRKWKGFHKKPVPGRQYGRMPFEYRFPLKALYGPRIQDYLGDPGIIGTLEKMAGERLSKNMEREVDAILRGY